MVWASGGHQQDLNLQWAQHTIPQYQDIGSNPYHFLLHILWGFTEWHLPSLTSLSLGTNRIAAHSSMTAGWVLRNNTKITCTIKYIKTLSALANHLHLNKSNLLQSFPSRVTCHYSKVNASEKLFLLVISGSRMMLTFLPGSSEGGK